MTSAAAFAIVTSGGISSLRQTCARVEKLRDCSDLRNDWRRPEEKSGAHSTFTSRKDLSRNETAAREPLWNGPQLNAAFVAQVIGQVMADDSVKPPASASAAYRHHVAGPVSRVFDGAA
jgi:hypothetical protein